MKRVVNWGGKGRYMMGRHTSTIRHVLEDGFGDAADLAVFWWIEAVRWCLVRVSWRCTFETLGPGWCRHCEDIGDAFFNKADWCTLQR